VTNKKMLVIDSGLLSRIDENRGDLSRSEFLHCLIENALGKKKVAAETLPAQTQYLEQPEFDKFKQEMRELLKNFLDFFLYKNLEIDSSPKNGQIEELVHHLQSLSTAGFKTRKPY
jgi:hypothetical protein